MDRGRLYGHPCQRARTKKTGNASGLPSDLQIITQLGSIPRPWSPRRTRPRRIATTRPLGGAQCLCQHRAVRSRCITTMAESVQPDDDQSGDAERPVFADDRRRLSAERRLDDSQAALWQGNSLGQDNDAAGFDPGTVSGLRLPRYRTRFISRLVRSGLRVGRSSCSICRCGALTVSQSPTVMNILGISTGNSVALSSGLTHLMATRTAEGGAAIATPLPTPEVLGGVDFLPTDTSTVPKQHMPGYGTAGYRIQHPEGADATVPNPVIDPTENRWHRLFGFIEVPTRSHRELESPPYQITAGTIRRDAGLLSHAGQDQPQHGASPRRTGWLAR